jgi:hypothetical protein
MPGGQMVGMVTSRQFGTRVYSFVFSLLALRRVTDATNGFRILRSELLADPKIDIHQPWLSSYELGVRPGRRLGRSTLEQEDGP